MSSVNKVILLGRLGKDPDIHRMQDQKAVCTLSVATSQRWNDKKTGEDKETTEWHNVVLRERLAEIAGEYLKKGSMIYVEGRLRTRKWEKDGVDRFTTEVVATVMQMVGPKPASADAPKAKEEAKTSPKGKFDDMEDDIPF